MDRYELLKRAAFIGDIESEERGGKIWFKPVDLLTWASKEWDFIPLAARALMAATGLDVDIEKEEAARAGADNADTRKGNGLSSSDVSEGDAAWGLIKSETRKPLDERQFKTRVALKDECAKLGAGWQAFERLYKEAEKLPGFIPFKKGKPRKNS
jgi:hypothetical protein